MISQSPTIPTGTVEEPWPDLISEAEQALTLAAGVPNLLHVQLLRRLKETWERASGPLALAALRAGAVVVDEMRRSGAPATPPRSTRHPGVEARRFYLRAALLSLTYGRYAPDFLGAASLLDRVETDLEQGLSAADTDILDAIAWTADVLGSIADSDDDGLANTRRYLDTVADSQTREHQDESLSVALALSAWRANGVPGLQELTDLYSELGKIKGATPPNGCPRVDELSSGSRSSLLWEAVDPQDGSLLLSGWGRSPNVVQRRMRLKNALATRLSRPELVACLGTVDLEPASGDTRLDMASTLLQATHDPLRSLSCAVSPERKVRLVRLSTGLEPQEESDVDRLLLSVLDSYGSETEGRKCCLDGSIALLFCLSAIERDNLCMLLAGGDVDLYGFASALKSVPSRMMAALLARPTLRRFIRQATVLTLDAGEREPDREVLEEVVAHALCVDTALRRPGRGDARDQWEWPASTDSWRKPRWVAASSRVVSVRPGRALQAVLEQLRPPEQPEQGPPDAQVEEARQKLTSWLKETLGQSSNVPDEAKSRPAFFLLEGSPPAAAGTPTTGPWSLLEPLDQQAAELVSWDAIPSVLRKQFLKSNESRLEKLLEAVRGADRGRMLSSSLVSHAECLEWTARGENFLASILEWWRAGRRPKIGHVIYGLRGLVLAQAVRDLHLPIRIERAHHEQLAVSMGNYLAGYAIEDCHP